MGVMQVVSEIAALRSTFIEELFEAMEKGLVNDGMEQAAPNERIVGQMNELEKALNFLRKKYGETEKRILDCLCGTNEQPSSPDERARLTKELESCRTRFHVADQFMWENIQTRLHLANPDIPLGMAWGIRANNQIVLLVPPAPSLEELFNLALLEMMVRMRE